LNKEALGERWCGRCSLEKGVKNGGKREGVKGEKLLDRK
jgi:hypothetical protein